MRILLVTDNWLPQVSGFTRTYATVMKLLEEQGDSFEVLHPKLFPGMPCPTYPEIRLAWCRRRTMSRRIDAIAPDAIHIALEGPLGLAARASCLARGIPFTTSYTTDWPAYLRLRFPLPARLTYAYLRWFHAPAQRCLIASPSLHRTLAGYGFENLEHWGRGVDTELFCPDAASALPDERPIWLYVGRVAVEKNVRAFLDLDLPGTKYVVGDGPQRAELQGTYPDVQFTGTLEGRELAGLYAAADVVVFPSRTDTYGLVLLEALASGVPVAAFPIRGPVDVLGEAAVGVLDEDLTRAAREALTISPETCRQFARQFSWGDSAVRFREALVPI
jgi:glycosyltransferase involved in cell wall biosynthesis